MSNRDVFLIPFDIPREEAVLHIINSLNALQANSEQLFQQATKRLDQSTSRVGTLHQRLDVLSRKVHTLDEADEIPFLCSPSTYPKVDFCVHSRNDVFTEPHSMTPSCSKTRGSDVEGTLRFYPKPSSSPSSSRRDTPSRFTYVYERPRFSEIRLLSKKKGAGSGGSQLGCELVPEEELYGSKREVFVKKRQSVFAETRKKTPLGDSLLGHCEFPDTTRQPLLLDGLDMLTMGDGSGMAPMEDIFDLPTDLPLPGASKFQSHRGKPPQKPSNPIDFSTRSSFYLSKDEPAYASLIAPRRRSNANDSTSLALDISPTTSTTANEPLNHSLTANHQQPVQFTTTLNLDITTNNNAQHDSTTTSSRGNEPVPSLSAVAPPPPPPPPPPPFLQLSSPITNGGASPGPQLELNKGHSDLMNAIRSAGGTRGANLKKVEKNEEVEPHKTAVDEESATKAPESDDLMSSLAKALELRRRGISGKDGKFAHVEKRRNKAGSSNQMDGALSRLREVFPAPIDAGKVVDASHTDDEWK